MIKLNIKNAVILINKSYEDRDSTQYLHSSFMFMLLNAPVN